MLEPRKTGNDKLFITHPSTTLQDPGGDIVDDEIDHPLDDAPNQLDHTPASQCHRLHTNTDNKPMTFLHLYTNSHKNMKLQLDYPMVFSFRHLKFVFLLDSYYY